jgi:hypothetical protein
MSTTTNTKSLIDIKLVHTENGFHDFNISNAGTIRSVTVSESIQFGEVFKIFYGDGHYVPHQMVRTTWLGRKDILGHLMDLDKSIRHSDIFIGESTDSDKFYKMVAKKHCDCRCNEPRLADRYDNATRTLLAFDLDFPEYSRSCSRHIIYLSKCGKCSKALTHGTGVGSFCTTGKDKLKALAEKEADMTIDFDSIITSKAQLI